ncbi:isoaspartyl peptidase/L-asparaginase family protein [Reichenbachiella ulvae]|uniref:Isoaspartyl peptidase/L-asparaginase n=1 Tax=Reichenbachiella ulvae TaxID=2980104 RepID=A0ABT3CPV4_9BACT|nr:isoaspartyl peptidase/L-asparaginase [Reichenbachiella ulvae]MCV9385303.1 isoaspartyl peptidase/L-asparaginase [Reichenbachiella ulvae]
MKNKYSLAIHGGAGTILKSSMSAEKEAAYKGVLESSLLAGEEILKNGGSSLDAVEASVIVLEDSDLFNAGKGSVFTADETHELEASIMCGRTLQAGAIGAATSIKNPVMASRKILDSSDYVYLSGQGADQFAKEQGCEMVPNSYFYSDFRYEQLQAARGSSRMKLDHSTDKKFGTVGAVALDQHGNLAAATSTGGLVNKKYGRLGDSSVIGSGVYANDATCAISCTGYGEFFLRGVVAHDISCLMEYKGLSLEEAAQLVINQKQVALGGEGGIIGVDHNGNCSLVFNSEGMYRGSINDMDPMPQVGIYGDMLS